MLPPPDLLLPEELPEERLPELLPELLFDPLLLPLLTLEPELRDLDPLLPDLGFTWDELPLLLPLRRVLFLGLTVLPEERPLPEFLRGSILRPELRLLFGLLEPLFQTVLLPYLHMAGGLWLTF